MFTMEKGNPMVMFIYTILVSGLAMFSMNPVILSMSLIGASAFYMIRNRGGHIRLHLTFLLMLFVISCINPLFYHNGVTVLFFLNNNPVTLEALLYGVTGGIMIISVLYWLRSFSQIMTGDRLLYVFGALSPKLSLILSMTMRYIPLFRMQLHKVDKAQRAMGLYREDNIIDNIRGKTKVFSIMVTWALENGITTSESMEARGYGTGKRSTYKIYGFSTGDIVVLSGIIILFLITIICMVTGALDSGFYPELTICMDGGASYIGYAAYGILAAVPSLLELEERIRWKYLRLKI